MRKDPPASQLHPRLATFVGTSDDIKGQRLFVDDSLFIDHNLTRVNFLGISCVNYGRGFLRTVAKAISIPAAT